jgi:ethanolamine-phosphate cytidylyltransferase
MQETTYAPNGENGSIVAGTAATVDSLAQSCRQSGIVSDAMIPLHQFLLSIGLPSDRLPSAEAVTYSIIVIVVSAIAYMFHSQRRRRLSRELQDAHAKLHYLQEKIFNSGKTKEKEVRIFIDGAFDVLHYGHMNAFRLGRSLGTQLVVGVNSDESITTCKGPPLMNDQERLTMVSACKFVDEVVPGVPYIMNREYLEYVIEKYNIDFVVHGDDPCIVDGKDVYATAKQAGKFRTIPRTEGVSTTDIVGRMLLMTKEHHYHNNQDATLNGSSKATPATEVLGHQSKFLGHQSKFLTTSRMLQLFSAGVQAPTKDMRVVYVDGAWDLFHPGHAAMLKVAREVRLRGALVFQSVNLIGNLDAFFLTLHCVVYCLSIYLSCCLQRGDYLIVGVHGDAVVNRVQGMNLPLMNLHERVLSVLGCRYVSDVLIDAPYEITPEMIASLNITEVVRGATSDESDEDGRYKHAKEAGIFAVIERPSDFSIGSIIERIHHNQEAFQAKFQKKMRAERQFYEEKHSSRG